jgi:hypothetical protein
MADGLDKLRRNALALRFVFMRRPFELIAELACGDEDRQLAQPSAEPASYRR